MTKPRLKPASLSSLQVSGDLYRRAMLNFDRLEQGEYQLPGVYKDPAYDWPADHEGRTILALTLLAQATHRDPKYLKEILDALPDHLNEKGYMGRIITDGTVDEQQLSGHSWMLRGLCEYYLWKKDESILGIIKSIVENLFLPTRDSYAVYPFKPEERTGGGQAMGSLTGAVTNNWHPSTDVGCAFIPLDGVTQAYEVLKTPELKSLIDAMIAKFSEIDPAESKFQTHATLSACRGYLRYYEATQTPALLEFVKKTYNAYITGAITENYENYNWFGRPEWTEPCAVIDSFIVAIGLWKHTGDSKYLEDAHHIFFNGMGYELRPTGGFGCNECAGARDVFLSPYRGLYEAWWCCLMRGGEGLSRAFEYSYFTNDRQIVVAFYNSGSAKLSFADGDIELKQTSGYPIDGDVKLDVVSSSTMEKKTLKLFIPSWVHATDITLKLNGEDVFFDLVNGFAVIESILQAGDTIELSFNQTLRAVDTINSNNLQGYHTFRHGPMILGIWNDQEPIAIPVDAELSYLGEGKYTPSGSNIVLSPINDLVDSSKEQAETGRRQILFRN